MFGDEVCCAWVQGAGEKGAHDQVCECAYTHETDEDGVEDQLDGDVEDVDAGDWELVYHHRAECVEEDLESAEKGLSEDGVEQSSFQRCWNVGVKAVDPEGFVVGQVVGLMDYIVSLPFS